MNNLITSIKRFVREEEGLTTVEYAVAGALITVAVVAAFNTLGDQITATLGLIAVAITPA